jgi:pimeloyl-ACP methyl ester carboxylesterase
MEPRSHFVQLDDIRLHYLEWPGPGRTAVLVHGSGLCASTWTPVAEALATRFRVVALDLRGHGDSDKPDGHYTWPEVVGDLPGFIDALGLRDILLVGHSRGGGVATLGGAQRPDRIWRMALMEPTIHLGLIGGQQGSTERSMVARTPGPSEQPPRHQVIIPGTLGSSKASSGNRPVSAHGANGPVPPSARLAEQTRRRRVVWPSHEAVYAAWSRSERLRQWTDEALWAYVKGGTRIREDGQVEIKCPPEVEAQFYENSTPDHLFDHLPNVTWPVLLLTTDNPRRQPDAVPGYMALRRSSEDFRHVIIPGASHFFPQERPGDVAQAILDFVSESS